MIAHCTVCGTEVEVANADDAVDDARGPFYCPKHYVMVLEKRGVIRSESQIMIDGVKHGMDVAISMARAGNLRLAPLSYERGEYPRHKKIRPVKGTLLIWKAWLKEIRWTE